MCRVIFTVATYTVGIHRHEYLPEKSAHVGSFSAQALKARAAEKEAEKEAAAVAAEEEEEEEEGVLSWKAWMDDWHELVSNVKKEGEIVFAVYALAARAHDEFPQNVKGKLPDPPVLAVRVRYHRALILSQRFRK
eukprot:SAG11_NODE_875_length_6768_cov_2.183686_3_plen_135_part_00